MMKALVTIFNMSISRHDGICLMSSFADQSEVRLWATCSRSHVQSVSVSYTHLTLPTIYSV